MSWSFIGSIFDVGSSWVFVTLLVKLGTSTMVGQYGLAMALLGPIFALSNMQMRSLQATDARQEFTFGIYFITRVLTLIAGLIALVVILVASREDRFIVVLTLAMFVRMAALAIQEIYYGTLQQHEWITRMAQVQMVASAALVGSFIAGLVITDSLMGGIIVSTCAVVATIFLLCIPVTRALARSRSLRNGLSLTWDRRAVRSLLAASAPLGIVSFLISMRTSVPRLLLNSYGDETQVGVLVALTAILMAGAALIASVSDAATPRMAWLRAEGNRHGFVRLLLLLELGSVVVLVSSVIGAWLIGPVVVRILYSSEYAEYQAALMWLAAACGVTLMSKFVGNAITVARRLTVQVVNNVIALGVMILLCFILIPEYGVTGASAAITLAGTISLALNIMVFVRYLGTWPPSQAELSHEK
jgi:O-antigen/teichoic acid export membrane protein